MDENATTWVGAAILHIVAAMAAGGAIGLERTVHGRAAGFRTYALLCMGATMALIVPMFPSALLGKMASAPAEVSRIVQGILTGIGFVGAGVIVKQGFSVRGLTTAASIWTTTIVGILIGTGHYAEAAAGVVLILCILSVLRWVEDRMRKETFAQVNLGVSQDRPFAKSETDELMMSCGLRIVEASYGFERARATLEYEYVVAGYNPHGPRLLAEHLAGRAEVMSYRISLSKD